MQWIDINRTDFSTSSGNGNFYPDIYYKSHDNDVEKTCMIHKKRNSKDSNELSHRLVEENNPLQFFK